jgi:hypothetical protein
MNPIKNSETEKTLEINKRIGLIGSWTKRVGVAKDSKSVDDIKDTKLIKGDRGIIVGIDVGIPSSKV